jgi:hypothetical protein
MKKFVFFLNITAIATFFVLFFSTGTHADCTKDIDCKGDRICEKGICVDPRQTEQSPAAINAKKQNDQEEFLRKINGARYSKGDEYIQLVVEGDTITILNEDGSRTPWTLKIVGRKLQGSEPKLDGIISDDGNTITMNWLNRNYFYKRLR